MGSILQTFLRALSPDSEHPHQHVTTALGCCSNIRIDDHDSENAPPIKDESDDASDLGGLSHARVGN